MGNTVVLKPAEDTSLTAILFAEICEQVGLPAGAHPQLGRERADTMVQMAIFSIVSLCLTRNRIDRESLVELATRQVMGGLLVDATDIEPNL